MEQNFLTRLFRGRHRDGTPQTVIISEGVSLSDAIQRVVLECLVPKEIRHKPGTLKVSYKIGYTFITRDLDISEAEYEEITEGGAQ